MTRITTIQRIFPPTPMSLRFRTRVATRNQTKTHTMAAAIANEFSEATTSLYLSALFEVGLLLFVITVLVNAAARLLIWRVARGTAVGSRAL